MFRQYRKILILTSLLILLPVLIGLLLWNQLPDLVPSHWGIDGEVDNWSSKTFVVFGLPALMLVMQWVCLFAAVADPKHKNYNSKMLKFVLWICPAIANLMSALVYSAALGYELPIEVIMPLLVGIMFIIMGNWLPKCRQTYTMGIKLPWTYASEANWNATHRFGGKVWVAGGIVTMLTALLGSFWLLMIILAALVILPTVYSYLYYRKYEKEDNNGN